MGKESKKEKERKTLTIENLTDRNEIISMKTRERKKLFPQVIIFTKIRP